MRVRNTNGGLTVNVIAGAYVVLLGMDMKEEDTKGLLGFAIERIHPKENQKCYLEGIKTFKETDPGRPPGTLFSTEQHPIQGFMWCDCTVKPNHRYIYKVFPMKGNPSALKKGECVEIDVTTEDENKGTHSVFFNRGIAESQVYARKFNNLPPDKVPNNKAWIWLSRGLEEAIIDFIAQAKSNKYALRAAIYELQYKPVLQAFRLASDSGADVKIVIDCRENEQDYPNKANMAAVQEARIQDLIIPRKANPSYISHNKFIVLLEDNIPIQVWTGSTNFTEGGIFGHSNVGHLVRDPEVAAKYIQYWNELCKDPRARSFRHFNDTITPVPKEMPAPRSTSAIFSPRGSLEALQWYASLMKQAQKPLFLTAAFGINDLFEKVLEQDEKSLRYILLDKPDKNIEIIRRNTKNRIAVGSQIDENVFGVWLREKATGLNEHVRYIHTKYMLLNPLSNDPTVISGSANFSNASTKNNDENMLIIRGDTRVADIYVGEFMRLFNHFYFRHQINKKQSNGNSDSLYLDSTDKWKEPYYKNGSVKQSERLYFSGNDIV